ncbi:MAG: putative rane protein, partial [Burkholderia sp.]|nr:putative rane protein [Burkholderia sp.]
MIYRVLADAVLLAHLAFALYAVLGGILVLRYPRTVRLHLPVLLWAIIVEWAN